MMIQDGAALGTTVFRGPPRPAGGSPLACCRDAPIISRVEGHADPWSTSRLLALPPPDHHTEALASPGEVSSMHSSLRGRCLVCRGLLAILAVLGGAVASLGSEPDPKTYWEINDIRPGMKGTGRTVMLGTKLEEFGAEVLGVMKGVSPGRDMVLCRLTGCNLEHAGIIQGMSGSPIYINGKLLGAVAYAWEFAKDPIAGITPFQQMVQYVRSNDRRIAAEAREVEGAGGIRATRSQPLLMGGLAAEESSSAGLVPVSGGTLAGMRPIAMPLAASGFSPRALALLESRFRPIGLAPMAGGAAPERVLREEGDKPLVPGAPLSVALVTGDFDLSGIGTVTHVEGDRVYGFGHPMFSLGACEFPMMTGYIHTVYPRANVSLKMGSPLKVVGVLDTDVSTGVAGRIGPNTALSVIAGSIAA